MNKYLKYLNEELIDFSQSQRVLCKYRPYQVGYVHRKCMNFNLLRKNYLCVVQPVTGNA